MILPPTVSEAQFLAAVSHVASVLSTKFRFGMHDPDDIAQMVAVFAMEAMPRYEPSRGGLAGFIFRHCANRLSNARRDEMGCRTDAPCRVCYEHILGKGEGHADGSVCSKFAAWWTRRQTRVNLSRPIGLDKVSDEQESGMWGDSTVESAAVHKELLGLIDTNMPLHLRADFLRMRADVSVPKLRRDRVLEAARDILDDPRQYENQSSGISAEEPEFDDVNDPDDSDE